MLYSSDMLTISYNKNTVLSLNNFSLKEKTILAIRGPNGSGKTTFLTLLAGLIFPTTGMLYYKGKAVTKATAPLMRKEVTLLLQDSYLLQRSVRENLSYPLYIRNKNYTDTILYKALDAVGLPQSFINKYPQELSGGEKQRVALATRLLCEPHVLLLDEPTASLDDASSYSMQNLLKEYATSMTIVIVSHDISWLEELTNVFYTMK